jgi:ATP phosphoribosyltransferase
MYQNLACSFFEKMGISVNVILSHGATEGKVPLIADAIIELVETGTTLQANHLKPIMKLLETTVHLIANNGSWGYTWKRRGLEEIAVKLKDASLMLPINTKHNVDLPDVLISSD